METVDFTDYLGNTVTLKLYEVGGKRVREWPDGSVLVESRPGNFRYFSPDSRVAKGVRERSIYAGDGVGLRRNKPGTHEPVTYYINREGEIGVPAAPGLEPPDDVTVHTANTLAEIDRLSDTMTRQQYAKMQDDGACTQFFEEMMDNPRQRIVEAMNNPKGRKEREIIPIMLADLDREERDRQKIDVRVGFRFRDFDR